jgi:hypothetical protein
MKLQPPRVGGRLSGPIMTHGGARGSPYLAGGGGGLNGIGDGDAGALRLPKR